ncbi:response regulator [Sulfurimonas sp. HSL3-7]|uniref:response regulator transcription factor n=1 Tax=Sulfonitrofixus jiaomeiensis TaxID=3131938 RepID=UPI0031F80C83
MFEKLQNKTILLVEDEEVIRENIASMLGFFFKKVYTASDGFDGLDQYEEHLPDIVMTDLKMPNMGGFELLEELKKRSSHAYTIIVSAHTDKELLIQAIHDGVDRYLVKPLTEDELFDAFNAYLEKIDNETPDVVQLSERVTINFDRAEATKDDQTAHLNKKEMLLLKLLLLDVERIFTYEEIENQVWGSKSMSLAALRSVVRDLRKKIGQEFIVNISGTGYRMQ